VIGNPPYISVESINKGVTEYYIKSYQTAYGRVNSFSLFIEKSVRLLIHSGICGLITSNRILTNTQLSSLRKLLLKETFIENILTFQKSVFKAAVDTTVLTFKKGKIPDKRSSIKILHDIIKLENNEYQLNRVKHLTYMNNYGHIFNVKQKEEFTQLIRIIENSSISLENICQVKDGIILGSIKDIFLSDSAIDHRYEKWLEGNEVSRYHIQWTGNYICYDDSLIKEELKRKREKAIKKAVDDKDFKKLSRSGIWLRKPEIFRKEKILTRQNAKKLIGVYDDDNYFVKNSLHCILLSDESYDLKYVLGLINSKLMDIYFQNQIGSTGEIFSQMKIAYIRKLPVRAIDSSDKQDKAYHDQMVSHVNQMLVLNKKLTGTKIPQAKNILQRQIEATDRQIDKLVYKLYDLTDEEIKMVES